MKSINSSQARININSARIEGGRTIGIAIAVLFAIVLSFLAEMVSLHTSKTAFNDESHGITTISNTEEAAPLANILKVLAFATFFLAGIGSIAIHGIKYLPILVRILMVLMLVWAGGWVVSDVLFYHLPIVSAFVPNAIFPVKMAMCFGLFAGRDPIVWEWLKPIGRFLAYLSIAVGLYYTLTYRQNEMVVSGMSPVMLSLQIAIWFSLVSLLGQKQVPSGLALMIDLLPLLFGGILAILSANRSWVIIVMLAVISVFLLKSVQSGKSLITGSMKAVASIAIVSSVLSGISVYLNHEVVNIMFSRLFEDTRSGQYADFFDQVPLRHLICGSGSFATYYYSGRQEDYLFIDNQILFTAWKWGLPVVLGYLSLTIWPAYMMLRRKNASELGPALILVFWFLALCGLSIYHAIVLNPQNLLIMLVAGRCFYLANEGRAFPPVPLRLLKSHRKDWR